MTERQLEIHKGLKAIGPEIAQFYFDGLQVVDSNLGTKSNILAHILREIDGSLRDIFEPKQLKKEFQKQLKNDDLEKIFDQFKEDYKSYDYLSDITFEDFKKEKGHVSSILVSFGFDFDHPLSAQYIKVVRWLAKYAHRSGAYNEPRNPKDIINLWNEFEDVLSKLIGNYYALADRIDSILALNEPNQEILKTLPNLLNTESRFIYFFNGLKSRKWLLALEKENYFDGSKNPEPLESEDNSGFYSMPYWGVLTYLEEVASQNLNAPEKETTESLVRIIDNICKYKKPEGERVENYRTDYTILKLICTIPEEYLEDRHFEFIKAGLLSKWDGLIGYSFNELLERLISIGNKSLLLKGVELLLTHKVVVGTFEKVHSIFRNYEFQRILSDFKNKLIPILGVDLLKISLQKIIDVNIINKSAFNNISIPAIENHEQTSFPDKYDCQLVYLVRDTLEKLDSKDTIEILKELLTKEPSIFKRIAIHIIRVRYTEFKDLFWDLKANPLTLSFTKHEVYELLKEHSADLTTKEIGQTINWINSKEYYIPEESKDDKIRVAKSIAYRKKEWLTSLILCGSDAVSNMLEELNEVNEAKVEHPGFNSWHSGLIGTTSPLSTEEIVKLSIEETIEFYKDFNDKTHDFIGPSVDGFIDSLTLTIRHNPEQYITECQSITNAPSQILYSWMRGLGESWRDEKKSFECAETFKVVKQIIQKKEFWESHNSDDNHSRWFISSLLSFIEYGLRDDSHVFKAEQLPIIKEILFNILENDTYPVFDHTDLSMTVLNNSRGRIYTTLFQYSLRLARLEEKDTDRWNTNIKELVQHEIELDEDNPLLFYVIGQFLPNIQFLDENWMTENFNKLFPIESKANWSAALSGYFYYNRKPNRMYFKLFKENQHLLNAITDATLEGAARNSLIHQICTAYLYDFESIEMDSEVIKALINSKSKSVLSSLIHFFWSPRFAFDKKVIHKIKPLWVELYKRAIKMEDKELDTLILSGCFTWLDSVDEIDDDIFEILSKSAAFVNQRDRYTVIEVLSKHINNYPERVGLILIELFKKEVSYDISRGKIQEMIENIYKKGLKDIGDKVCLLHAEKGFHFLRDIYIKNNP
jgi:hypothetical protein